MGTKRKIDIKRYLKFNKNLVIIYDARAINSIGRVSP